MLKCWTLHSTYRQFISDGLGPLSKSDLIRLHGSYQKPLDKFLMLDLDLLLDALSPYYSSTGRPAILQPEIFRSLMLMIDCGFTSLKKWYFFLRSDSLLSFLIGCDLIQLPSLGSYYNFINRFWLRNSTLEQNARKHLYRYRCKWRCPLACGKIEECSCKAECSPSEYDRVIYTKPSDDPRIFTPVPRCTKTFKDMFKTRTCSELSIPDFSMIIT